MKISLSKRKRFAVLIPTKGRAERLAKNLEKRPFLNRPNTFIAVQSDQWKMYRDVRMANTAINWEKFDNPHSSGGAAREHLRRIATEIGFDRYVPTDDNCEFSEESLENLIRASEIYPRQPCIVSGMHGTAPHFDAGAIKKAKEYGGLHFYKKRGAIFWAIPHSIYSRISYPVDIGILDDQFVSLAALKLGCLTTVVCMEAKFNKKRFQSGGYTDANRNRLIGMGLMRLATDFPEYMDKVRITFPWTKIVERIKTK